MEIIWLVSGNFHLPCNQSLNFLATTRCVCETINMRALWKAAAGAKLGSWQTLCNSNHHMRQWGGEGRDQGEPSGKSLKGVQQRKWKNLLLDSKDSWGPDPRRAELRGSSLYWIRKIRILSALLKLDSGGLGQGWGVFLSNKLPGGAPAAGLRSTLGVARS